MGTFCDDCLSRIPYATLIATIMCCLGVGVFCYTMYQGAIHATFVLHQLFEIRLDWLERVHMTFTIIAASMAALGFMILCVGCLATGATRTKVYRAWRTRVGGRVSCAVFMTITYLLKIFWLLIFGFLIITSSIIILFHIICKTDRFGQYHDPIDLTQFSFLFPNGTDPKQMKIESTQVGLLCNKYVPDAELLIGLATTATLLIILSLVHYLMCLSANYAHIRDHEKFQELQELQYLQDPNDPDSPQPGMGTLGSHHRSKDRF